MPLNTNGINVSVPISQYQSAIGATAALLAGAGSSSAPMPDNGVADKNFVGMWTKTTATSGDNRAVYWRHYFSGAGGGEVIRAFATVATTNVATGGTVNGIHASLSVNASSSVSGAGNAIRATLGAASQTRTLGGTCAALQLDSDIGANNTVPSSWSFIRVTDSGSVRLSNLFTLPDPANGTILATHTDDPITHSIKCITANGTVLYLMATTTATHRG